MECELKEESVVKDFLTTATDSKDYLTKHYNLDLAKQHQKIC